MTDFKTWRTPMAWEEAFRPGCEQSNEVVARLRSSPPLVFARECDLLTERLAQVAGGEGLVLQSSEHTQSLGSLSADAIMGRLRTLLQMAAVLSYAASVPVVKIVRLALPDQEPTGILRGYESSAAALNLVRALVSGGYADLGQIHEWNRDFVSRSPARDRYTALADEMGRALSFMRACRPTSARPAAAEYFVCHEALPLVYESALTHVDSQTGNRYNTAGHFVRIGARSREHGGVYSEYIDHFTAIRNPIGVEIGPGTQPDYLLGLLDQLDPAREPGRLTFLVRMGAAPLRDELPELIEKVMAEDRQVGWICTPVSEGPGLRRFGGIPDEVTAFFEVHQALGTHPGGFTADLTADVSASLDLAFLAAESYRADRMIPLRT